MGLSSAHLADADPMKIFTKPVKIMMPTMVTCAGSCMALSQAAPFNASKAPRFDFENASINKAAKKCHNNIITHAAHGLCHSCNDVFAICIGAG